MINKTIQRDSNRITLQIYDFYFKFRNRPEQSLKCNVEITF